MNLLGFHYMPGMRWADVRSVLNTSAEWPLELERAMDAMASGQLPPPLSPFRSQSGIFIPVIVRAEMVDRILRQVFVIFVPADADRLGALFEGSSLPVAMPSAFKALIQLLRLMFRARWEILEPRRSETTYKNPPPDRCSEIARTVLSEFDELNSDLANLGVSGDDAFHELFDSALWNDIDATAKEWLALTAELRAKSQDNCQELSRLLTAMRNNNATWINLGARQFAKTAARFCGPKTGP